MPPIALAIQLDQVPELGKSSRFKEETGVTLVIGLKQAAANVFG